MLSYIDNFGNNLNAAEALEVKKAVEILSKYEFFYAEHRMNISPKRGMFYVKKGLRKPIQGVRPIPYPKPYLV